MGVLKILGASLLTMAAVACGGATAVSSVANGPSPVKCPVSLAGAPEAIDAGGASASIAITTQPECAWSAAAEAGWLMELAPASGQGSGEVRFRVAPNPDAATRQAAITIGDERVQVVQAAAPCRIDLTGGSQPFEAAGGAGTLTITAPGGCPWDVTSGAAWITITSNSSGTGNGTVSFRVTANIGPSRASQVTIGDQTFTVSQLAPPAAPANPPGAPVPAPPAPPVPPPPPAADVAACTYTINPTSYSAPAAGGAGSPVAVATAAGCGWNASSAAGWITVTAGASGNGPGTVTFSVSANSGAARTGSLTIAGRTFTVSQQAAPCAYAIAPTSLNVDRREVKESTVTVTTAAGCQWTAKSNDKWIDVKSGDNGTGPGVVKFHVDENKGSDRTGTITIAGLTFTIRQSH